MGSGLHLGEMLNKLSACETVQSDAFSKDPLTITKC